MNKEKAALLSVSSNFILVIFKLLTGIMIGSVSVISEAIHSGIDLLASIIAFFSIKESAKAEDLDHPFGHGKYENVSGFVEALLILLAGILIIYESIKKLISGSSIENTTLGIIVMLIATITNFIISKMLLKISKQTDSIALEADGMHLLTDVFTSLGVLTGLIIVRFTGIKIIDSITAILVAVLIIKTSIDLIKKSLLGLLDNRLPEDEIKTITNILQSYPEVTNYHRLRTRKSGQKREIDFHLKVNEFTPIKDAHEICDSIENSIKVLYPNSYILIHVEPDRRL